MRCTDSDPNQTEYSPEIFFNYLILMLSWIVFHISFNIHIFISIIRVLKPSGLLLDKKDIYVFSIESP